MGPRASLEALEKKKPYLCWERALIKAAERLAEILGTTSSCSSDPFCGLFYASSSQTAYHRMDE
jgi:hypothetical protein